MDVLAFIDAEIARLRACRAAITRARFKAIPPKAAAVKVPRGVKRPGCPVSNQLRVAVAKFLLAKGPLPVRKITIGAAQSTVNLALRGHPWFRKTGPDLRDPWHLTPAGLKAAKKLAAG